MKTGMLAPLQYILPCSRGHFTRLNTALDAHVTRFAQRMTWWKVMSPLLAFDINHITYFPLTFPGTSLSQLHARECPTHRPYARASQQFEFRAAQSPIISWAVHALQQRRSFPKRPRLYSSHFRRLSFSQHTVKNQQKLNA